MSAFTYYGPEGRVPLPSIASYTSFFSLKLIFRDLISSSLLPCSLPIQLLPTFFHTVSPFKPHSFSLLAVFLPQEFWRVSKEECENHWRLRLLRPSVGSLTISVQPPYLRSLAFCLSFLAVTSLSRTTLSNIWTVLTRHFLLLLFSTT